MYIYIHLYVVKIQSKIPSHYFPNKTNKQNNKYFRCQLKLVRAFFDYPVLNRVVRMGVKIPDKKDNRVVCNKEVVLPRSKVQP